MFNLSSFKKNIGQILLTLFYLLQYTWLINFLFFTQLKSLYSFLNQFKSKKFNTKLNKNSKNTINNKDNPPKRHKKSKERDEDEDDK